MDSTMTYTLSIINLIFVFLIIVLFFLAVYAVDKSTTKQEQPGGAIQRDSKNNEPQQKAVFDIDNLTRSITELEKLLKIIVETTQRHESILSGAQSKGALGEQLMEERLANLPHEWYDRNVSFPGGTAEFALRVPNGRWIPIDSQWTATDLLVKIGQATDHSKRNSFRIQTHQAVSIRARNAMRYLNEESTLGFCIVAVPDPVFDLCVDMQANLTSYNIVLISYSLLIPYILLIVNQFLKTTQSAQTLQTSHIISRSASQIELIQKYINKEVVPPLEIISRQQTQHGRRNQGLENVYTSLNQIQKEINILKSMINPVPNLDILSIPQTLQRSLNHVLDGLLENASKQNGRNTYRVNK